MSTRTTARFSEVALENLADRYARVRATTETLCRPLAVEDQVVQSMPDASPTRWHLAHTSWFFETFVLEAVLSEYRPFHPEYRHLFNSYYNAVGPYWVRPERGLLSRPTVAEIMEYRAHVDRHLLARIGAGDAGPGSAVDSVITLGLHHEQQHQELILTDILHALSLNPLHPTYRDLGPVPEEPVAALSWPAYPEALREIGFAGQGFAFDNETPRHRQLVGAFALAGRLVTNREYQDFMDDDGYRRPELWLSDGWGVVQERRWRSPLYWRDIEGHWYRFSLAGLHPVCASQPVCHVSHYEADAYARWAGVRLPTEAEWETAAAEAAAGEATSAGNFLERDRLEPLPWAAPVGAGAPATPAGPAQLLGDVWEWTASPYVAYPGYRPPVGALGEYNGKFMSGQMVLRGGSCVTPRSHIRSTYRNFFRPDARWQFMGIRLARDV